MTITIAILMLKLQSNSYKFPSGTIALMWSY